jgi:hypothetical protein
MATPEAEAFWYEHCTPDQEALVAKFAAELERGGAVVPDQLVLKRFLRARQWDVGQATSMYMAMQEYRRETKVEEIARSFVYEEEHSVQQCYPRFYHKTDRYGRPVYIELLGQCSVATLLQVSRATCTCDMHQTGNQTGSNCYVVPADHDNGAVHQASHQEMGALRARQAAGLLRCRGQTDNRHGEYQ